MATNTQPLNYFPATDESRAFAGKHRQFDILLSGPDAKDRPELERFIGSSFRLAYGAQIRHFMPLLLSLRNANGDLLAVCGLRNADAGKLFLEAYLDEPIDAILSEKSSSRVPREGIVEIGNFAAFRPGMARHMIAVLATHIHKTGAGWIVFTATPGISNACEKFGINLIRVCKADKEKLDCNYREEWGNYYDTGPYVMAGNVPENYSLLLDNFKLVEILP